MKSSCIQGPVADVSLGTRELQNKPVIESKSLPEWTKHWPWTVPATLTLKIVRCRGGGASNWVVPIRLLLSSAAGVRVGLSGAQVLECNCSLVWRQSSRCAVYPVILSWADLHWKMSSGHDLFKLVTWWSKFTKIFPYSIKYCGSSMVRVLVRPIGGFVN